MTDTGPKTGAQENKTGPNDDPQDMDSLQKQARHETSKAEGEDADKDRKPSTTPPVANPD